MRAALLVLTLAASPALAETPLTAEGFEAHVTGKTITYQQGAIVFGIEEYLPNRAVRWSVAPGLCQYGTWYPEGEAICFVYEDDPTPHCWTFWLQDGALAARLMGEPPGSDLQEVESTTQGLDCPGPDVGV